MTASADRTPIFLSALVYPGAGQLLQRRWRAGLLFCVSFTLFFVLLLSAVLRPLIGSLDAAFAWAAHQENKPFEGISVIRVATLFVICAGLYVANVIDATRAARRRPHPPPL